MSALLTGVHNTIAQRMREAGAQPLSTSTNSSTGGSSAVISSNDFLQLLVTEMQNQDPTSTTDPNQYIDQLVNVNSLEQLISINQELGVALGGAGGSTGGSTGGTTGGSGSGSGSGAVAAAHVPVALSVAAPSQPGATLPGLSRGVRAVSPELLPRAGLAAGNLSVPPRSPAAARVAHALDGSQ